MYEKMKAQLKSTLGEIEDAGLLKRERPFSSSQSSYIEVNGRDVLNFCANNYLGLANRPEIIAAAKNALDEWGFGVASVRFICGTQDLHLKLEAKVSQFLGMEDTILFSSCFDANGGVFEALFGSEDAIISDELNHASIIDGIRLSKAARYRYANRNMGDLEVQLIAAKDTRQRVIVTDGVFSMDGYLAPLQEICDLADKYGALVMVDDSHAVGFMGECGRGTPEFAGVEGRIDFVTGTFGKALGGAAGGYVSGRAEIIALLRQRARPYLFSNSLPPAIVAGTLTAIELASNSADLRKRLFENASLFRKRMMEEGFNLLAGEHPIIPVMFGDASLAASIANHMLEEGVYVTAFSYPVVPHGKARIRVQLSAIHTAEDIESCVRAFVTARTNV
ncbi:MAG: glycine C-acetyltransferase [Candidatus Nanopelagicaceae bacterium]|nr:glycine C-acetyltransferase [Candidatus Nanopelagicaceae bacterium]